MYRSILPWTDTFSSAQRQVFWLADLLPAPSRRPFGGSGNHAGVSSVYSGGDRAGFSPGLPYSPGRLAGHRLGFTFLISAFPFSKEIEWTSGCFYLTPSPMACQRNRRHAVKKASGYHPQNGGQSVGVWDWKREPEKENVRIHDKNCRKEICKTGILPAKCGASRAPYRFGSLSLKISPRN